MTDLEVELYVRSLAPAGARPSLEATVERLQRLEADGRLAAVTVHVTGKCVCPEGALARTDPGEFLLERVEAFEAWAERTGRDVEDHFRRVDAAGIDGSDFGGVRFPVVAMAEYEAGDLRFVSPSGTGTAAVTVQDRLAVLESTAADARTDRVDGQETRG